MVDRGLDSTTHPVESDADKLARYEDALRWLSVGALGPTMTAHPFTAIGRIAARLLDGAVLEEVLRELRQEGRG